MRIVSFLVPALLGVSEMPIGGELQDLIHGLLLLQVPKLFHLNHLLGPFVELLDKALDVSH